MANKIPSWCKNAVATVIGWAHPLTGEQLVSHSALEDTVDFYRPNAGTKSFIDPQGEVKTILKYVVNGNRVDFRVHSLENVLSVSWDLGDGNPTVGGTSFSHTFDGDGLYNVWADVSVEIDGEPDVVTVSAAVRIGVAPPVVAPDLASVSVYGGEDSDQPVSVGLIANAITSFNGTPDFSGMVFTYQWKKDGVDIVGQTRGNYTPVEADEGAMLSVTITVTNSAGSDTATSPGVEVLPAV